jgi:hypothetical protein
MNKRRGIKGLTLLLALLGIVVWTRMADPELIGRLADRWAAFTGSSPASITAFGPSDIVVDASGPGRPISPLIYGVAFADQTVLVELGATVDRWGGNTATRYNWVAEAWNAARDWEFRNKPAGSTDDFVRMALAGQATPLLTVPTIGWVSNNGDNGTRSTGVPAAGGPPLANSDAIAGYNPDRNRAVTSVPSLPRKPGPLLDKPDPNAPAVYQDEWIHHLMGTFGSGAPRYFAMDNEPDAWSLTHTDVRPAELGYDQMVRNFEDYATAVKQQDHAALILGPDVCCWTSLFYSPLDRGSDNFGSHADRQAHGDVAFLPWWLAQVARQDAARGSRSLDLLDVHYYPAGNKVFSDAADPNTRDLRIRSVRSLYDSTYTDESWIGTQIALIPRLKKWIANAYPGTGLAISEYNFGGEKDASGAIALAEALGTFGVQGVDLATYWTYPAPKSPAGAAFRLFRNYDGAGATFGDESLGVVSGVANVRAYASRHANGEIDVILANESQTTPVRVPLKFEGRTPLSAESYRVAAGSGTIEKGNVSLDSVALGPLDLLLVKVRTA